MIKAVIFDFDGVVAESKEIHYDSYNKALKPKGVRISKAEFSRYFGYPSIFAIKVVLGKHRVKGDIKKITKLKNEIYLKNIGKVRLNKNAITLIKKLHNDYKIVIASNTRIGEIEVLTKKYKIKKYITLILGWGSVKKHKPHPEIYLKAAKKLKLKPKECIVIEDSQYGVEAAKRAGMKCIAVLTTHNKNELKKADFILKNLGNINKIVDIVKTKIPSLCLSLTSSVLL